MIVLKGDQVHALSMVLQVISNQSMPAAHTMNLLRLYRRIQEEAQIYIMAKTKLLDQHARREDGSTMGMAQYSFESDEARANFDKELGVLNEQEVRLELPLVPWDVFQNMHLSIAQLDVLSSIIDFPEEASSD